MSAIEPGGHYLCAGIHGYDPVRIWVGRIDPIDGAGDVVSALLKGDGAGLRTMAHVALRLDAILAAGIAESEPFPKNTAAFEEGYTAWRQALDAGHADYLTISPSEAYGREMAKISDGARHGF
jgi:hypothetical protein